MPAPISHQLTYESPMSIKTWVCLTDLVSFDQSVDLTCQIFSQLWRWSEAVVVTNYNAKHNRLP